MVVPLDRGREAYRRQEWGESYAQLSLAARETRLELEDLERLAAVSYLTGRDDESDDFWARAHHESLRVGDPVRGARCAFWLGNGLMLRGGAARVSLSPTSCPTAASAWCIALRSCSCTASGPPPWMKRSERANGSLSPSTPPSVGPTISRPSFTGCAASSQRPRTRIGWPASGRGTRSPAWPSCGWSRVSSKPRRGRSAAWWTRHRTE